MQASSRPGAGASRGSWRATCALLLPGGEEPPSRVPELEEALLRRGVDVVRCAGVHDAMAQAVLAERRRRMGEASDPFIVVVVEPGRQEGGSALVDAAQRHAPSAVFWQYTMAPEPRLTSWSGAEPDAGAKSEVDFGERRAAGGSTRSEDKASDGVVADLGAAEVGGKSGSGSSRGLRLAGEGMEGRSSVRRPGGGEVGMSGSIASLSDEELSMLLKRDVPGWATP